MDSNINIDKIVADLEKKYTGDDNHDLGVIQEYCRTLPPCEESAKLVAALGKYASEKFPGAEAFKIARVIEKTIQELEKSFNGDPNHDVKIVQDYCQALPKTEENFRIAIALGQYAAAKYPEAEEVKKSKAEFDKMNEEAEKTKKKVEHIQELIQNKELEPAIEELRSILKDNQFPEDDEKRLVSFSNPFEEILFQATVKESRPLVRISNLTEMLNLQLGSLLAELERYDEAREALNTAISFNPVSGPANLELAHISVLEKKYEEGLEQLNKTYPLIYSRQLLAVFFYLLAIIVQNVDKNYPLAAGYAHLSLSYADNPPAHDILNRLEKEHGTNIERPEVDVLKKLASDADLPLGPCKTVVEIALQAGQQLKASHPEVSKQCFAIAYEITGDDSLLKELR